LLIDPCTLVPEQSTDIPKIEISPNPADNFVNIAISGLKGKVAVALTRMDGAACSSFTMETDGQRTVRSLDLSGFSKGIYLIRVKTDQKVLTEKLVVR